MNAAQTRSLWSDVISTANQHLQGVEWNFNSTFSMIMRRWVVLAASVGICLALAVIMLMVIPPKYTSVSLMQINTRMEQVAKVDEVLGGLASSDAAIRTEVDVITSRKLAGRVVDKLKLYDNADLSKDINIVGEIKTLIQYFLFPIEQAEDSPPAEARDLARTRAVNILLSNLQVSMKPRSFTIEVRYTAKSPELAARVANAVAQEYLNSQLEDRFEATRRANSWINERLQEMRKNLQATELAVQRFREENNLTEAKGIRLSEQQISELNSQLILARTQLAETQAKSDRATVLQSRGRGIETATEVLQSPLIMSLRQQETEVRRNMSELASRYGSRHPRMQNIRNELRDLQSKIHEEINKIQGSLENDVAVSQARVATLEAQLDALQARTSMSTDANVQLAELERQAAAEKSLYESFLLRSKEIGQMDFAQTDARVISAAEVPLVPSSPKKSMFLLLAIILGSGIGIGLMLLLEALDAGFRTAQQLEGHVGLPVLGMLTELPKDTKLSRYVLDKPTAAFTEAIRSIRTSLQFANPDHNSQVVLITSSVPQEGKSAFSISFAQLAAKAGSKVLLVDADLRRPSLTRQLDLKVKQGLAEVLVGKAKASEVIQVLADSKLAVMPALSGTQFAQELLTSQKMKALMTEWRKQYDLIVIDSPPVMAVADAVNLSSLADSLLFMVRWGTTPRALVANAIRHLKACNVNVSGCVMTRVDMDRQQAYGKGDYGYYYGKYKEYYSD